MNTNKNIVIVSYLLISIAHAQLLTSCSCKNRAVKKNNETKMVTIKVPDEIEVGKVNWEEISSLEKVVILETTQESLITNIDKLLTLNEKYYIMDWKAKSIFVFDKDGKFISRLSREGGAPGEYRELRDFDIDQDGNLHILDYRRILVYDPNFNFIKHINLEHEYNNDLFIPLRIAIDPNQEYYLWKGSFGMKEISKNTGTLKIDTLKFGNEYSLGLVIGSDENTLISAIDSYIINMTLENMISNINSKNTKEKFQKLQGLDKDSNPLLLLHKISGF